MTDDIKEILKQVAKDINLCPEITKMILEKQDLPAVESMIFFVFIRDRNTEAIRKLRDYYCKLTIVYSSDIFTR